MNNHKKTKNLIVLKKNIISEYKLVFELYHKNKIGTIKIVERILLTKTLIESDKSFW